MEITISNKSIIKEITYSLSIETTPFIKRVAQPPV